MFSGIKEKLQEYQNLINEFPFIGVGFAALVNRTVFDIKLIGNISQLR